MFHRQTILHDDDQGQAGNCLQAAVASYLDWDSMDAVPHFLRYSKHENDDPDDLWWLAYAGFAALLTPSHVLMFEDVTEVPSEGKFIVTGKSPRGEFCHVVVYENGKLLWDPHPSDDGIDDVRRIEWFAPVAPTANVS